MDELKKMHEETQKERINKEKTKKDRKSALQNRLKKVRDRKRLKLGLPMIESDDEPEVEAEKEASKEDLNKSVLKALKDIREKEEEAKRNLFVRDWDVGKKESPILNVKPTERKVMDQNEWVQSKRSERPKEFAPPVNLYKDQDSGHTAAKSFNSVPPPTDNQQYRQPAGTKSKQSPRANTSTCPQQPPSHNSRQETPQNKFNNMFPPGYQKPSPQSSNFSSAPPGHKQPPQTSNFANVPPPGYQQPHPQSSNFANVPPPGYQQPQSQSSDFSTAPPGYQVAPPQSSNFASVPPPGYKTENKKNKRPNSNFAKVQPPAYTSFQSKKSFSKKNNVGGPSQNKFISFETMYEVPEDDEPLKVPEKVISSSLSKLSRLELHKQMVGGCNEQSFRLVNFYGMLHHSLGGAAKKQKLLP